MSGFYFENHKQPKSERGFTLLGQLDLEVGSYMLWGMSVCRTIRINMIGRAV
jgi:hypothetical protein